jgi:uncharacterized membrane protein (UPF0182 family)
LALGLRLAIFFTLLISIGTFIGYNLRLLCRTLPAVPPTAPWFAALVLAALIGFGATTLWAPLLGFLGTTGSGPVDPVFGNDIAFYLLVLPWYDAVVALVITALVMTIALWALIGLAFYPSTGRPWHQPDYRLRWSGGRALRVIDSDDAESWTESEMVWRSWWRQGLVLAALFCVAMGLDRFLGRYHLVIAGHSQVVAGGSYADVNFWVPAYDVIIACWFAAGAFLAVTALTPRLLGWLLQRPSRWAFPGALFAIVYFAAVIIPPSIEQVYVVAVPVNEIDARGNPVLWAHDIPIRAKGDLAVRHGEIYYGMLTRDRVYVRTSEKEFYFPQGQANAETVYEGKGGIPLSSFWRKLVVANETDGLRLFISGYFLPESRVLLRRNIVERVERLAPFLIFDHDPYIVADGDHYSYIIDAYTSSANYPYSDAYQGSLPQFHGRNYLRNSVKAVVDAYNGSVTFYVFDKRDPIVDAYWRMLPGFFKNSSEMPTNLRRHIRYPEDLFTVQAEMYGTYHMTDPTTFYNREDRWEVPRELYRDREIEVTPYYVMAQLPNADGPEFLLMLPLSVAGKNQMAGWLAGLSDGENYGKMVAFRFPKGTFIDGPAQVESRINSDSRFSGDLTLWDQHGSQVIRGNLIVLPLNGNQLIAIEPVYIEAEQTKIPTLARVVLAQLLPDDRKIEWARSLAEAEDLLVGAPARAAASANDAETETNRLDRARAVFQEMQQQYASGNFTRYGELLQQLENCWHHHDLLL